MRTYITQVKLSTVFALTPRPKNTQTQAHPSGAKSTPVCVPEAPSLAGSCVEWDYVNLSLVEVLSPTPAHNCQKSRQTEDERRERRSGENKWERGESVEEDEQNEQQ